MNATNIDTREALKERLRALRMYGLVAAFEQLHELPWLEQVITLEHEERQRRTLENRMRLACLGTFKSSVDFDWSFPKKIDRLAYEELSSLAFLSQGCNVILMGPNGVGKTMLMKNLGHRAVLAGHRVMCKSASEMLRDLLSQDGSAARMRRMRLYTSPTLLCIDEVGYLSYESTHADLLFEVVTRRYENNKSIALTSNRAFGEWGEVFPNAACVTALVDRLTHRAEVLSIEGDSYRHEEALKAHQTRQARRRSLANKPKT